MSPGNVSFDWAPEVVGKHGISVEYDALGQFSSGSAEAAAMLLHAEGVLPQLVENFPNRHQESPRNPDDVGHIGLDVDEKEYANESLQETPQIVEDSELPEECW